MASIGPLSPGTMADDSAVGSVSWSNPDNAKVSDDTRAINQLGSAVGKESHYLKATNFGFSIPVGATINGIVVEIERSWQNGSSAFGEINDGGSASGGAGGLRIVKGGSISSTDRSVGAVWTNTTDAYSSYGSSSDLWGETWTAEDINASTFGFVISVMGFNGPSGTDPQAKVDHIRITVYYTVGVAGPTNLKSYNTNLKGNIKSINTNLIANVKSLNTNI